MLWKCPSSDALSWLLLSVATIAATLASAVLRPDNMEVASVLWAEVLHRPLPSQRRLQMCHGLLMFSSAITVALAVVAAGDWCMSVGLWAMAAIETARRASLG